MQDHHSGNYFIESESHFESVEFDKQGNLTVDMSAGASEAREYGNSKFASPVEWSCNMARNDKSVIVEFFTKNESGSRFSNGCTCKS